MKKFLLVLFILLTPFTCFAGTLTISGDESFFVGDFLRLKDSENDEWMEVTAVNGNTYTVTRDMAGQYATNSNPTWKKGSCVTNFQASGEGGILMTSSDANSPHIDVVTHAGAPWATLTTHSRLGNLNGFLGYSTDKYGIAIGESSAYLKYDPTNGLRIKGIVTCESGSDTGTSNQLLRNGNFEVWTDGASAAPDGWTLYGAGAGIARSATHKKGTYSVALTRSGTDCQISADGISDSYYRSRTLTLSCWVYATVADRARLAFYDDGSSGYTFSSYHTGGSGWELLTVTATIHAAMNNFYLKGMIFVGDTTAYFDGAMLVEGNVAQPYAPKNYSEQFIHPSDTTKIDGGNIYTRTVTADKITAGTFVGGIFEVGNGGSFRSANYVADTSGFKLDHTALELNDVTIMNKGVEFVFGSFQEGFLSFGGDGSDGDVTISSNTDISGETKQYNNLTINAGVTLTAKNSIIGVKGTLTVNGTITANAGGGAGGTCPLCSGSDGTEQGTAGIVGDVTGCGGSGGGGGGARSWNGSTENASGSLGGACQQSGGAAGSSGGVGGTGNAVGATYLVSAKAWYRGDYLIGLGKGAGGGGGSAAKLNTNGDCTGGTGGVGGGWLYIEAKHVTVVAAGIISANGANGNNGSVSGGDASGGPAAGGGGGGGGGVLVIRYSTYSNSGTVQANGGTGGAEAHTPDHAIGGAGGTGGAGQVWTVNA